MPDSAEITGGLAERLGQFKQDLPPSTLLIAVSKGQTASAIREAVTVGQRHFGESRLQEAVAKQAELADLGPLDWHFIGRLQANKARAVLRHFNTIHSCDSLKLAQRLQRISLEEGYVPNLFLQVKLHPDPAKTGFEPDQLRRVWPEMLQLNCLHTVGLMTIPPLGLSSQQTWELYSACSALADELGLAQRSMGMSSDWKVAVRAGSTVVRIGTDLFGKRLIKSESGPG